MMPRQPARVEASLKCISRTTRVYECSRASQASPSVLRYFWCTAQESDGSSAIAVVHIRNVGASDQTVAF